MSNDKNVLIHEYYLSFCKLNEHDNFQCVSVTTMANDICKPWYCCHAYVRFIPWYDI